jgi:hypothetical protein
MHVDFLRDKFLSRFGNIKASKEELDRMFRQFLWEEEEMARMQFIMEAEKNAKNSAATVPSGDGAIQPNSTPTYDLTLLITVESPGETFYLQIGSSSAFDATFSWGDGVEETYPDNNGLNTFSHLYDTDGNYEVRVIFSDPSVITQILANQND